jgi:virginiamycin B lyase
MIPSTDALPYGIGIAPDGKVYFAEYSANNIAQLDPTTNQIRERSVGAAPYGLYISPSGSLFYTLPAANALETMVFTGGTGRWNLPTPNASPDALVSAPTGPGQVNLWIAERGAGKVARFAPSQIMLTLPYILTPASTVLPATSQVPGSSVSVAREYHPGNPMLPPPIALLVPATTSPFTEWQSSGGPPTVYSVAVAPDGRVWYSEAFSPLVSLDPTSNTALYYGLPSGTEPFAVFVDADGQVWFTDTGRPSIGVLNAATGDVYLWPIPGGSQPYDLVRDTDGNVWFTDREADAIGRLNPATDKITMYSLDTNARPVFLVLDGQNRVWFTAERGNYVGLLSVSVQPEPETPSIGQGTLEITTTPSGAQVYIDGTYRGTTPVTVPLAAGAHSVVLKMPGFPDAQRTITIYAGSRHTMTGTFGFQP